MDGPCMELPRYKPHKEVHALKIGGVSGHTIIPEDRNFAPIELPGEMFLRYKPTAGDYLVVYEDGYRSFSPGKAFEAGYSPA